MNASLQQLAQSHSMLWMALIIGVAAALFTWGATQIAGKGLGRYRERFTDQTSGSLREMFLFLDAERLFLLHFVLICALVVVAWFVSGAWPFVVVCAALGVMLPRWALAIMRHRRLLRIEAQLPDALLIMAGAMRAGSSLTAAIQQLEREGRAPITQEFALVLREQRLGVSVDEALTKLDQRVPLQAMTLAVSAMRIATETGGGLAEALERAASTLRAKLAMEGKIRALTSQGKLQAIVVGLLPVVMLLVLLKMEPVDMGKIFTTQAGWAVLVVVALMEFFGVMLIRKIVAIDV
jgi:tight adherence protein B